MKHLLTILLTMVTVALYAQSSAKPASSSGDCFKDWYALFKERGANPIADGTHEVIITLRYANYSECYLGKIDVANGKIAGRPLVQKVDGSYEEWDKKVSSSYLSPEGAVKDKEILEINNGMSSSLTLADGEIVRLFFYKSLADKPKANKKAPAPGALLKN